MITYYCETCHTTSKWVKPVYHKKQEEIYYDFAKKLAEVGVGTISFLVRQFVFLQTEEAHWNFSITCPLCGVVHTFWSNSKEITDDNTKKP